MIKNYLLLFCLLLPSSLLANSTIGTVSELRGAASVFMSGTPKARRLKAKESVREDAAIVTYRGSFIRIKLNDGSTISLGPNSKIIITKMNGAGSGIVTLLNGQLRARLVPREKKDGVNKFLIRTKSAAIGSNGADFQALYNSKNSITNLLVFSGEVAISKGEHKVLKGRSYNSRVQALSSIRLNNSQRFRLKRKLADIMERSLSSAKALVVKAGQFSSSVGGVQGLTLPVNISPMQLGLLYENTDLAYKVDTSKSTILMESTRASSIRVVPQEVPKERTYDRRNAIYAQKSGGFIDLASALYIPPAANAVYSQKIGVYVPRNIGGVESETGQYVAPEGLTLDAEKGFLARNLTSKDKLQSRIERAKDLNTVIDKDVVIRSFEVIVPSKFYSQLELFTKDSLAIKLTSISNTIDHTGSSSTSDKSLKKTGNGFSLMWNHAAGGKWQPVSAFHYKNIRFSGEDLGVFNQGSSNLFGMDIGMRRFLSERFNFSAMLKLKQNYYTSGSSTLEYRLQKSTFTNLDIGGQYLIIKSKRFDVDLRAALSYVPSKTGRDVEIGSSSLMTLGGGLRFWLKRNSWVKLGLESQSTSFDISSENYSATDDNSMFEIGLELGFIL